MPPKLSGLSLDDVDDEDFDGGFEASMERRREILEAERAEKWEEREWAKRERESVRLRLQAKEQEVEL